MSFVCFFPFPINPFEESLLVLYGMVLSALFLIVFRVLDVACMVVVRTCFIVLLSTMFGPDPVFVSPSFILYSNLNTIYNTQCKFREGSCIQKDLWLRGSSNPDKLCRCSATYRWCYIPDKSRVKRSSG